MTAKLMCATFVIVATTVAILNWNGQQPESSVADSLLENVPANVGLEIFQEPTHQSEDEAAHPYSVDEQTARRDVQLENWLNLSKRKTTFQRPSKEQILRFEHLFLKTLEQASDWQELKTLWANDGWRLEQWEFSGGRFFAIREQDNQLEGRGFYVVRMNADSKIVLQAPHCFFDSGSGEIAQKLFVESNCLAAAWNTVHRKQYDLAHHEDHFINAFTRALIKFEPETLFAQLHGFANEKQKGIARTAELIVSDGTKYPGRHARAASIGFKQRFGTRALLYPLDVKQLGGTQNEQGIAIRDAGCVGFLHIELNKSLREKLEHSASLRKALMDSLADSY